MTIVLIAIFAGAGFAAGWAAAARRQREERRLQARLLSFAAHEVNTPITSLFMTVMNFKGGLFGPIPDAQEPWMTILREQTCRLKCLVGDMRDLLHAEFHKDLVSEPERTDVRETIEGVLETTRFSNERASAAVETRLEEDLPAACVNADRLHRILSAVLAHARKFRTQGAILLSASSAPDRVLLRVEYTGVKTPPEELARELDLYFPVRQEGSEVLKGVGMGLGLTRLLIETEGGTMTLEGREDGRTVIGLGVPRHKGDA